MRILDLLYRIVRKHPAPQGALRHVAELVEAHEYLESESTHHQKAYSLGVAVRWLPTAPENGQSDRQSLEQALRANPSPPPRAPSSSTTTKVSTPGGFMPGELAGFQQASHDRNAYTAGTGQADANQKRAAPRNSAAAAHSPLIPCPPTSGQAVRRPGGRPTAQPSRPARRPRFRRGAGAGR